MTRRKIFGFLSLAWLGFYAAFEVAYAFFKNHPVAEGRPHKFIILFDPVRDYWQALGPLGTFLLALPMFKPIIKYFRRLVGLSTIEKEIEHLGQTSNLNRKLRFLETFLNEYEMLLNSFEDVRDKLKIKNAVQLRFRHYTNIESFKRDKGNEVEDILTNGLSERIFSTAIVGRAGIGKSYTLLTRITQAIKAIDQNNIREVLDTPLPVMFRLGNWKSIGDSDSRDQLDEWMADQLRVEYEIEQDDQISWLLLNNHIVPILDGLDEVPEESRESCFRAIAAYHQSDRSFIFSCRKKELGDLVASKKQVLGSLSVYELLPLTPADIKREIESNQSKAEAVNLLNYLDLHQDIYELIDSPLILNLFQSTYTLLTTEEIDIYQKKPSGEFLSLLWKKYDEKVFEYKDIASWKKPLLRNYAVWMAKLSDTKTFHLDKIQSGWLLQSVPASGRLVAVGLNGLYFLFSRVISAVLISIGVGLIISEPFSFVSSGIFAGIQLSCFMMLRKRLDTSDTIEGSTQHQEGNKNFKRSKSRERLKDILLLSVFLMVTCGIFQGTSVPRRHGDMYGLFSVTECLPGILLGLFCGIVFGYRRRDQYYDNDINPVEKFDFNFTLSWTHGVIGGALVGLLIGVCGAIVELFFRHSTFYSWLGPYISELNNAIFQNLGFRFYQESMFVLVFAFAFCVGFPAGFVIVAILSGRDEDKIKEDEEKKNRLNFGIFQSGIQSIRWGFVLTISLSILYGGFLYWNTDEYDSVKRAVMIGGGIGIIGFLWFGGFEVIQHWTLRLLLFVYGIIPLRIGSWIRSMHQVAFIYQRRNSLEFQHQTLKEYLRSLIPNDNNINNTDFSFLRTRRRLILPLGILFLIFCFQWIGRPFRARFVEKHYWNAGDQMKMITDRSLYKKLAINKIRMLKSGELTVEVRDKILVGTFVGRVGAEGTMSGFLGFSMGNAYNLVGDFRHGALLYRVNGKKDDRWAYVVAPDRYYWPWDMRSGKLDVSKGDVVEFCINDKEWENDAGLFTLKMTLSKTAVGDR